MFRTILLLLFLFVHLSYCDHVEDNQIQTTTAEELLDSPVVDDTVLEIRGTTETTETTTILGSYFDDTYTNNVSCDIKNVSHVSYPKSILVRWNDCRDKYNVNITRAVSVGPELPHFRRLNDSSMYNFTNLEPCTAYNISVKSDSGDEYLTTIRTLPEEIQDLKTYVFNNTIYVNWSLPESQDCKTFNLLVDESAVSQTRSNNKEINYNLTRCTTIKIDAIDTSNQTGSTSTRAVPGIVQNFKAIFNPHNITLSWDAPADTSCVTGYIVQLDDQTPIELVDSVTYTFTSLEACVEYTVAVAAHSDSDVGEYSSETGYTETPTSISAVQNLNLQIVDDILNATWSPPNLESACVTAYSVVMWAEGSTTVTTTTTNTYYEFTSIVPCKDYNVMIVPMAGTNQGVSDIVVKEIEASVTNPPTLRSLNLAKTSCTINLQLDVYSVNMCQITKVIVNCTAEENENGNYDWIIRESNVEHNHTDSSTARQVSILVENLSEYTNYTCYASVINTAGQSEKSDSIEFTTLEEVPSAPQNLTYEEEESDVLITWTEPYKIPGILGNYKVAIETISSLHYIPEECSVFPVDIAEETNEKEYYFRNYLPNHMYNFAVAASTGAGFGDTATINITTGTGVSEVPRNVTHNFNYVLEDTYNVTLIVNWLSPCNTNGQLSYYDCNLLGQLIDDENDVTNKTHSVMANDDVYNSFYELNINNIQPRYTYTFTLAAYTDGNTRGEEYQLIFSSPEGYPSKPLNLEIDNITATSAKISWEVPSSTNGEITSYRLVIKTSGPIHYIPNDCDITYLPSNEYNLSPSTFVYLFEGMPYFQYTVSIAASTNAGYGPDETAEFNTLQAESSELRNVNYSTDVILGETYSATLSVDWILPCNTNGILDSFMWTLEGTSLETMESFNQTDSIQPNELLDDVNYGLRISNLLPMSSYVLKLTTLVDGGNIESEEYKIQFESPDGYSSPPLNLRVENLTAATGNILWEEPLNKNGEIQSYRIGITTDGPAHNIPDNCDFVYDEIVDNVTLNSTTFDFKFTGLPNFKYTVTVAAANGAGYGFENTIYFTTLSAQSEQPRNVSYYTNNTSDGTYKFSVTINWILPCNTNGNLLNFLWILSGQSLENGDIFHNDSDKVAASENIYYQTTVSNILPYYNYTLSIAASVGSEEEIPGKEYAVEFISDDGYPSAPLNFRLENLTSIYQQVSWDEPSPRNGEIQKYNVIVRSNGPNYNVPDGCHVESSGTSSADLESNVFTFSSNTKPNFNYGANVAASTRAGYGPDNSINFSTPINRPEAIQNIVTNINETKSEVYQSSVIISFDKPCNLHDDFSHYATEISGERQDFPQSYFTRNITEHENNQFYIALTPQFTYNGIIKIYTKSGYNAETIIESFTAPSGVPSSTTADIQPPEANPTSATFILSNTIFDNTQGDIMYYAIIINLGAEISTDIGGGFDFWDSSSWPQAGVWLDTDKEYEYQVTPVYWNPFSEARTVNYTYIIGESNCSSTSGDYCNGPLRPNTQYALRVRGFTKAAFRDTKLVYFTTPSDSSYIALILGVIFGVLAAILILIFIFILWRRRKKETENDKEPNTITQMSMPPPIPKNNFVEHCQMLENNRNELKAEYSHLDRMSAAEKPSSYVAMENGNKKKNRYINIMPYDNTRVKLTTDNNDNYEDYINASYIRGYSGNHEYIATQGPMESTLEDFWRMIIQEDVGIIVMVAHFVEQSKQKCFKYFPEKEETMTVGEGDFYVKCTSEVDMTDYIMRSLIVEKDGEQMMVKHLQYMLWPDFGCPTTTHSMLEFREIVRKHIEITKNKAVIHCSAGVGRTGTLIAIDILFQKIDNSDDDIDVFGTVLDLRKQRTHMVQTEKQYEYIHKCLMDYLKKPKQTSNDDNLDPIYENVAVINGLSHTKTQHENNVSTENLIRLKEL